MDDKSLPSTTSGHTLFVHARRTRNIARRRRRERPLRSLPARAPQTSREPFPAGPEALLEPAVRGPVVADGVVQVVGEVLLRGDPVGLVVRVDVPLAVTEPLGPCVAAPPQVRRDGAATARAHVGDR